MWNWDIKSFFNETLTVFVENALDLLHFGSCQNCISSANPVAKIHSKLWIERTLSTGEPSTCEYVALLKLFYRGTLIIHWYVAQDV